MAKRILVPLGDHDRAEAIVPVVAALAREGGGTVRLLHVEPPQRTRFDEAARRLPVYHDVQVLLDVRQRLLAYAHVAEERLEAEGLARLGRLDPLLEGVAVERAVRFGDVVDEIAREADAFEADLIAVTERRRPWWRPALAPIVERLRSRVRVPVLALSGAAR
ncbi:MAG TPA: universal stress protein [Methylomirabilota bacterium]|nr:universal stress protein [Methylomirabilota bacterium]